MGRCVTAEAQRRRGENEDNRFSSIAIRIPLRLCVSAVSIFAALLIDATPALAADEFIAKRDELFAKHAAALESLAIQCDQQGLAEQARITREWLYPRDPRRLLLSVFPTPVGPPPAPEGAGTDLAAWHDQFWKARQAQGDALFELAGAAIRSRRASLALELVLDCLREDPDHESARRLIGYRQFKDEWHTLYEIERLRKGQVWDERFGWILKQQIPRYEQGERYDVRTRRWISAADDAARHAKIETGWTIETEHYLIRTNHSLEAGVALASRLERIHRVWQQVFFHYFAGEQEVAQLFQGKAASPKAIRRHEVIFFRDREEYETALAAILPMGVQTAGIYAGDLGQAYFFAGDQDFATLFHEATHQLFHESREVAPAIGKRCNFWIVEGVACYMESLSAEGDFDALGGTTAIRYRDARFRRINDSFYVPLAQFAATGVAQLQRDPRIPMLYSQASGLTHFLMHYDQGRYRDALVLYLIAVYTGRDGPQTLAELTGTPYEELDKQYLEFLTNDGTNM